MDKQRPADWSSASDGYTAHADLPSAPDGSSGSASSDVLVLPPPDFWQEEKPRVRGPRYLSFDMAACVYAMPLTHVREIDQLPPVTSLPNVPVWVLGAANLRGDILSVVDLSAFLELGVTSLLRETRLIASRAGNMEVGLVVERVLDIRELPDEAIQPASNMVPGRIGRYLAGSHAGDGRLTLILDVPRLLHSAELRRFE